MTGACGPYNLGGSATGKAAGAHLCFSYENEMINMKFLCVFAECQCFERLASKFVSARLTRMVCTEDTRIYTGSDGMLW